MTIWATIPVGKREHYLPDLLDDLHGHNIVIINNHPGYTRYPGIHHVEDFGPINIYRWWNTGINYAEEHGATTVAVLNDDLRLPPNYLNTMHRYLTANNLAIVDTENSSNNGGAAWIMDLHYCLRLDERFRWWYGDTELFQRAHRRGLFGKLHVDGFTHLSPNGHLVADATLQELVNADTALYAQLTQEQ